MWMSRKKETKEEEGLNKYNENNKFFRHNCCKLELVNFYYTTLRDHHPYLWNVHKLKLFIFNASPLLFFRYTEDVIIVN